MGRCNRSGWLIVVATLWSGTASAQSVPSPTSSGGRIIETGDGDVVIVPEAARVAIVRRSEATARLLYFADQQTVLLITDAAGTDMYGGPPDRKAVRRWQIQDPWPLDARWEGTLTVDEYMPGSRGPMGLALHTDRGVIFLGHVMADAPILPRPLAVVRIGSGSRHTAGGTFDEIEQAWLKGGDAALGGPGGGAGVSSRFSFSGSGASGGVGASSQSLMANPAGAIRVGGNVRAPARIHHVEPVLPPLAEKARVAGVVIVELTIGTEGGVTDARVLRSIPLLDQAALDAVRQWRYEPTALNGHAVPVIMTVTVEFSPRP